MKCLTDLIRRRRANPWLQAALDHVDNLVAAGITSQEAGNAQKAKIRTSAKP